MERKNKNYHKYYDLICIGSGISAMYSIMRFLDIVHYKTGGNYTPTILVLTQDSHIGGRIQSLTPTKNRCSKYEYMLELCAMRFFPDIMPYVAYYAKYFSCPITVIPGDDLPVVTPQHPEIIDKLKEKYPPENLLLTSRTTIASAVTFATFDYSQAVKLVYSIGFGFLLGNVNLLAFYADPPLSGNAESRFKNGFQSLVHKIYEKISPYICFKNKYCVNTVERLCDKDTYLINNEFTTQTLIYTGTLPQFNQLNLHKNTWDIANRRLLAGQLFRPQLGIKCFIQFDCPWWGSHLYKYSGKHLITHMECYNKNTLLIYMIGPECVTFINMFNQSLTCEYCPNRNNKCNNCNILQNSQKNLMYDTWLNVNMVPGLMKYILCSISDILQETTEDFIKFQPTNEQLYSATQILLHVVEQAISMPAAINDCEFLPPNKMPTELYNEVRSGNENGFYYLSGDLSDDGGGWVEKCLNIVEMYICDIATRILE